MRLRSTDKIKPGRTYSYVMTVQVGSTKRDFWGECSDERGMTVAEVEKKLLAGCAKAMGNAPVSLARVLSFEISE